MPRAIDKQRRTVALGGGLLSLLASAAPNTAAAEVDIKAEEAAVRQAEETFFAALSSGDVEQVVRLLAQDVVLLTRYTDPTRPGRPMHVEGIETARQLNERFLSKARNLVASIAPTNIAVAQSGDLAYVIGDFEFRFELVGYGRMVVRGRNLHIFKKVRGEWKIAIEATVDAATERS
jgi:ketosteroid isomerase-like protein